MIASRIDDSPAARPSAPSQSIEPVALRGRSGGTTTSTIARTSTVNAVVNQKTRWYPASPLIRRPTTTRPVPPPNPPSVPDNTAIADPHPVGGAQFLAEDGDADRIQRK